MTKFSPYDVNQLEEIIIFDGDRDIIELSREGKYINLIKESEYDKRYFRFNLQTSEFERINFYKTVDDKISKVSVENITYWFSGCKLITKDLHFGRLVIYAKNCYEFDRYSSPVRFVQQLGHRYIKNLEQWEALGVRIIDIDEWFGDKQVWEQYNGNIIDHRKDIYLGRYVSRHSRYVSNSPSECSKEILFHIKALKNVTCSQIHNLVNNYNNGEMQIERDLIELHNSDEFADIFMYTEDNYRGRHTYNVLEDDDYTAIRIRNNIYRTIRDFSLDLEAFCRWIKKQKNVEKNDVGYLFETNHYRDYLRCEFELKDGSFSKMVKYPDNFRTEFHKAQIEFEAVNGNFDEFKFKGQKDRFADYEHTGKKFCMLIPEHPNEIKHEASELHHCVRSYIQPMTEGETLIMFMRDKKYKKDPLITVEVRNEVVRQAYGDHDSKPLAEHLDYIRHWANMKGLRMGCWGG